MALFTAEEARDIREYVYQLDADTRYRILQVVRMLEDDGADEETSISAMYHLCKNPDKIDDILSSLSSISAIPPYAEEGK